MLVCFTVSQVVRKRADRGPSRPNSARSNRPGSAGQDTSQAGKSSSPELALHNIAVPKTPGILKAKTSAVQVVYVPRGKFFLCGGCCLKLQLQYVFQLTKMVCTLVVQ